MRQIRPDGGGALRAQAAAQRAQHAAHAALRRPARPARRRAAASARRNTPRVLRPLKSTLSNLRKRPDQHPVLGEQQPPQAGLLVRRAAPEDGHRHEIDVEIRIARRRRRRVGPGSAVHAPHGAARTGLPHVSARNRPDRRARGPMGSRRSGRGNPNSRDTRLNTARSVAALPLEHVANGPRAAAMAAAASSGLMVTLTHRLRVLRTAQCHARLTASTASQWHSS